MLTYKQALMLAEAWLRICVSVDVRILEEQVVKKPYGWVFFYQSTAFLSGDPLAELAGNAPLLVDRCEGEIRVTGTARRLSEYLAAYESTLPKARLEMALPRD